MLGITSYGAYIPVYRLSQSEISRAWGGRGGRGEKAVANYDEDSITMAVEAAIDCLNGMDRHAVDGLYFASTTPPYGEKQSASIVAAATDLRNDIFTLDLVDSLRSGTSAVRAASDAVKSGSAKMVLVTAADCRLPAPNSEFESVFGDGAAAFLIGDTDVAVSIEGSHSISSDFLDMWKRDEDIYVRTWEDRFILEHGYTEKLSRVISQLMKKHNLTAKDFTKVVYYAPDARSHRRAARSLGFDPAQIQEPMFDALGNTGTAFAPMMLVAALEQAKPGDRILWANYGDGADAFVLKVTEQIKKIKGRRGIKHHLESKMPIPNYEKYVRFRDLMEWEPERRPSYISSLPMLWRDHNQVLPLHGGRCRKCGHIQLPIQRVCAWCQTKDDYEEVRLSDKKATVFTFSMDERAIEVDLPRIWTISDFDDGGRFYCVMTDRDPAKVDIGMRVEMTFRKIHDGAGLHNYFWKCRPIRVE
jgi:hydroxymethylglutaryl-CoA synthase